MVDRLWRARVLRVPVGPQSGPGQTGPGLLPTLDLVWSPPWRRGTERLTPETITNLDIMKVDDLRKLARDVANIGLSGREISTANKETLVREIKKAFGMK